MSWSKLVLIFIFSLTIRLAFLGNFPPGLNWDEASLGYNAYSLLKTGRDEWGVAFPSIFRAFGDYKLPGYIYMAVLPESIFGLNPAATRLPSALFGSLVPVLAYILFRYLKFSSKISLLTAVLSALTPWSWFLSRIALEANLAGVVFILGLALVFSKNYRRHLTGFLFLASTVWIYNSFRVFVPPLILGLFILRRPGLSSYLSLLLIIPMFLQLFSSSGLARYSWVSILDAGGISQIESQRNSSSLPSDLKKIFYNKISYLAVTVGKNYISHFSPGFLFINGGSNYQFNPPNNGLIYPVFAPFFYLGILFLIIKKKLPGKKLIFLWTLLAPLPASLTRDAPHTLRFITFLPLPYLFVSYGFFEILRLIHNRIFRWSIILITVLLTLALSVKYFFGLNSYRKDYSWSWQYGYSDLVSEIKSRFFQYDRIIITKKLGEPQIFFLYYWPWGASDYREDPRLVRYFKSDWYWVDSFSKFVFVNDWEMDAYIRTLNPDLKYLIAASVPEPLKLIKSINYLDGKPAFYLYEK